LGFGVGGVGLGEAAGDVGLRRRAGAGRLDPACLDEGVELASGQDKEGAVRRGANAASSP